MRPACFGCCQASRDLRAAVLWRISASLSQASARPFKSHSQSSVLGSSGNTSAIGPGGWKTPGRKRTLVEPNLKTEQMCWSLFWSLNERTDWRFKGHHNWAGEGGSLRSGSLHRPFEHHLFNNFKALRLKAIPVKHLVNHQQSAPPWAPAWFLSIWAPRSWHKTSNSHDQSMKINWHWYLFLSDKSWSTIKGFQFRKAGSFPFL